MGKRFPEVERFLKALEKKYKIEKAVVFGSRVGDDYLETSDIDVLLVSKDFEGIPFVDRMSKLYEFWKGKISLEALCYTPQEFAKKKKQIGIVSEAVKNGIEVRM